ncbi:uracil-DNA glycosylase family protein [Mesorhizobium atlanticum]
MFDSILDDAEIDRRKVYVTNAVKHFKFEPRRQKAHPLQAQRRRDPGLPLVAGQGAGSHQAEPRGGAWRDGGAGRCSARRCRSPTMRGDVVEREDGLRVFLTIHPSFILRIRDQEDKDAEKERFLRDMRKVRELMGS